MNLERMVEIFRHELTHKSSSLVPCRFDNSAFIDRAMTKALVKIVMEQQQEQTISPERAAIDAMAAEGKAIAEKHAAEDLEDLTDARAPFKSLKALKVCEHGIDLGYCSICNGKPANICVHGLSIAKMTCPQCHTNMRKGIKTK